MDASSPRDEADIDPIILADVARVVEQLLKQGGGTDGLGDLQALLGPGVVLDTVEEDSEKIIDLLQVHRQQQEDQDMQDLQEQQQQVDDDSNNDQQYGESQEQCAEQPKPADRDIVKKYIMEEDKGTIPTESANGGEGNLAIIPTPIITTTAAATAAAPVISPSQMKHNTALLSPTLNHNKDSMESEKKKKKNIRSRNTTSGTCSSSSSTPSILLSPGGHAFGPDREDHVYYEHPPANYYPPQVTEKLPMASSAVAYHTQITSSTVSSSGVLSPSLSTGSLSSIDKRNSASDAGGTIHDPYTNGTAGQTSTTGFASSVMTTADHATSMLHSAMLPSSNLKITRPRRKKALLIGINYFGDPNQLPGCINDTRDIFGFLNGYYGFRYQDTVMLTDDQIYEDKRPSGANIRYWMKWLVQDAEPHDSLFFHYA
ncbi:Ca(2+)-dependent cysteine protease, partial [Actinomortierella ambigua]